MCTELERAIIPSCRSDPRFVNFVHRMFIQIAVYCNLHRVLVI